MGSVNGGKRSVYRPVLGLALLSLVLCGLLFPLVITGIAQAFFPYQANGSPAQINSRVVGSYSIDNGFSLPIFFHGRNETNQATASASGVDPDIALQDALSQVPRIHAATGIPTASLINIVMSHEQRTLWIAGDPYVNVLSLNLGLINTYPATYSAFQ